MASLEFKGDTGLTLLRKQFPDTWQELVKEARQMISAQRRLMKGVVSVEQAATACIMRNKPALSVMAAAYLMATQEKLLQEHIELELEVTRLTNWVGQRLELCGTDHKLRRKVELYYDYRMTKAARRTDQILMQIKERALTMGDKPHTFQNSAYCPPTWERGKGFLNT